MITIDVYCISLSIIKVIAVIFLIIDIVTLKKFLLYRIAKKAIKMAIFVKRIIIINNNNYYNNANIYMYQIIIIIIKKYC